MNKRTIVLASVLVVAVAAYLSEGLVFDYVLQPIRQREARVAELEQKLETAEDTYGRIRMAERRLEHWGQQSLPGDPSVASTLYQNWLVELANRSQLEGEIVTPNRISSGNDFYWRIPFTVEATGKLDQLCDFFFEFHRTDLLHKIKEVQIEALQQTGDPDLSITMQLEAIALKSAADNDELLSNPAAVSTVLAHNERSAYALITQRNPFVRAYEGPGLPAQPRVPPTKRPSQPPVDLARHVFHVGTIISGEHREAWLYDRHGNSRFVLKEGDRFDIRGVKGTIVDITRDSIQVDVNGESRRFALASSLRELDGQPAPTETPVTGSP